VLDTIQRGLELGYWVEVVTLVVPGLTQERRVIARLGALLREINPALPWHLNGFVPRYRMTRELPADPLFLLTMAGAAYADGSQFVYVGNAPACAELAHTRCPQCREVLVRRHDYATVASGLANGGCSRCGYALPGVWH
jgi:pyruvate formate lyase activating enzyme